MDQLRQEQVPMIARNLGFYTHVFKGNFMIEAKNLKHFFRHHRAVFSVHCTIKPL
jgi:hypothetical protein